MKKALNYSIAFVFALGISSVANAQSSESQQAADQAKYNSEAKVQAEKAKEKTYSNEFSDVKMAPKKDSNPFSDVKMAPKKSTNQFENVKMKEKEEIKMGKPE